MVSQVFQSQDAVGPARSRAIASSAEKPVDGLRPLGLQKLNADFGGVYSSSTRINRPEGGEPSRRERLAEMGMACRMLGERIDTILLFDEMEDLFGAANPFFGNDRPSKVHTNRMLETNPIPVIWTTNSVESCDPAFLRLMSYSALMRPPSGRVRARIWQRLAKGGLDAQPRHHSEVPWQPELVNADMDLALIEARLAAQDAPRRVSFCLDGPAGTGKSAWARHLARRIGMPVVEKRASDLISKWLGESERNIARAFTEARAEGTLLIFDEAESLLADRRNVERSWKVSQVNEILTRMESHPLPFVCTTNLVKKLDPATQRRFTFRIRFDTLSGAQMVAAWRAHFDAVPPDGLARLERLASGDFANVARRMRPMGETRPAQILHELTREAAAKEGASRPIGFGRCRPYTALRRWRGIARRPHALRPSGRFVDACGEDAGIG